MKKSRLLLWLTLVALSGTGIALHFMSSTNADELPHPLNGLFRSLHGVVVAISLIMFGYFFSDHVQKQLAKYKYHWRSHLWDAYLHLSIWALLIVTGLLLYYPQEMFNTDRVSAIHWYVGLVIIGLFPLHFWRKPIKRYYARQRWERMLAAEKDVDVIENCDQSNIKKQK